MAGIGFGIGYGFGKSSAGFDADAQAYFNAVTTPFTAARKVIINTLVTTLKADGNWTKLDRLWLLATEASDQALISLVNPSSTAAVLVNAPAFEVDRGFTNDSATSYINTNYTASTDGVNYTQNSASFGVYKRTGANENGKGDGAVDGTKSMYVLPGHGSGNSYGYINDDNAGTLGGAVSDPKGFTAVVRTASTASSIYLNGTSIGTDTASSTGLATIKFYITARNTNGTASLFEGRQTALCFIGSGTINQSTFYSSILTYLTAIGANV